MDTDRQDKSLTKKVLARIFAAQFLDCTTRVEGIPVFESEMINPVELRRVIKEIIAAQLAERSSNGTLNLTPKGRKEIIVVMTGGSFDIIHPGHLETLQGARSLGDVLIVSVARNSTFLKNKKRSPLHDEKQRKRLVEALKSVDAAFLGSEKDIYETVELLQPDLIALGYDQAHNEDGMKEELLRRGLAARIVRLDSSMPNIKSSRITKEFY